MLNTVPLAETLDAEGTGGTTGMLRGTETAAAAAVSGLAYCSHSCRLFALCFAVLA